MNPDDIMVEIGGKWGDAKMSLTDWCKHGPNPRYPLQGPGRAWKKTSGIDVPLNTIPYPFLNDGYAAQLVLDGVSVDPWNRDREQMQYLIEILTESNREEFEQQYQLIKSKFLEERAQSRESRETTLYDLCWKAVAH